MRRWQFSMSEAGWLHRGESLDAHAKGHTRHPWYLVIWLTGVDYFSTLGYQPGIALLAAVFLKGFAEAIELATAVCVPYLFLNAIVLARALVEVLRHPTLLPDWQTALFQQHGGNWTGLALASLLVFPKLALGLSGFETGVSVMPLIRGGADDSSGPPRGLIRHTRKLLATAPIIMSVMLVLSSFVTALLIPEKAWRSEEHTSELQSPDPLLFPLLLSQ